MPNYKRFIFCGLLLTPLLNLFAPSGVYAQDQCAKELAEAEEKFRRGRLNEVIDLVQRCLQKSALAAADSQRSYWLLGKAYHAKSLLDTAKVYLRRLLEMIPEWRPDPENDSPAFQALAQEVIKEVEAEKQKQPAQEEPPEVKTEPPRPPEKGGSKKWLWIGGGALAAGTVAFLVSQGEEKPPRLPDPPALPRK